MKYQDLIGLLSLNELISKGTRVMTLFKYNATFCFILLLALVFRLWSLGDIGFYGDEDISAMAAKGVLNGGYPILPSGMFYPRAIPHSYIMAASVWLFGMTEWAFRFPSALAGVIGMFPAYSLGRKYLSIQLSLLFVSIIGFTPWLLEGSKYSRMYIFLVVSTLFFVITIIKWSESEKWSNLFLTVFVMFVALSFHQLAIFLALLFFFPLGRAREKKVFFQSIVGFAVATVLFGLQKILIKSQYDAIRNESVSPVPKSPVDIFTPVKYLFAEYMLVILLLAIISFFVMVAMYRKNSCNTPIFYLNLLLLAGAYGFALILEYHIALILYVLSCIVLLYMNKKIQNVIITCLPLLLIFIFQYGVLLYSGEYSDNIKLIKELVGSISLYGYVIILNEYPLSVIVYILIFLYGIYKFITEKVIPLYIVFFLFFFFLPLLAISFFKWYVEPRYIVFLVPMYVFSCLWGCQYFYSKSLKYRLVTSKKFFYMAFFVLFITFFRPGQFIAAVDMSNKNYPDHKGAAEFVKNLELKEDDIIIALDLLQQYNYNVDVDYWLRCLIDARKFTRQVGSERIDIYTNTPLIGTGDRLKQIVENNKDKKIIFITTGESYYDYSYFMRNGILEVYQSYFSKGEVLFIGQDGKTMVWGL